MFLLCTMVNHHETTIWENILNFSRIPKQIQVMLWEHPSSKDMSCDLPGMEAGHLPTTSAASRMPHGYSGESLGPKNDCLRIIGPSPFDCYLQGSFGSPGRQWLEIPWFLRLFCCESARKEITFWHSSGHGFHLHVVMFQINGCWLSKT